MMTHIQRKARDTKRIDCILAKEFLKYCKNSRYKNEAKSGSLVFILKLVSIVSFVVLAANCDRKLEISIE